VNGKGLYSPKIKDDLIPIIYKKGKIQKKPMTDVVDDILRQSLLNETDDESSYICCSCLHEVSVVDGNTAYCDYCQCSVFCDKA